MPNAFTATWPRNCSVLGSDRIPTALALVGLEGTCGTLVFVTGSTNDDPEAKGANDYYIYINGTNPMTPMFGNVTNMMTTPAGGAALGAAVAAVPWDETVGIDGAIVYGTQRVSTSFALVDGIGGKAGIGLMTDSGASIEWLYVAGATPTLCHGTEAQMLAGTVANALGSTTAAATLGARREGRTLFGHCNRDQTNNAVVIQSGGKGAALALMAGDHHGGIAMYFPTAGAAPVFTNWQAWWTWAYS